MPTNKSTCAVTAGQPKTTIELLDDRAVEVAGNATRLEMAIRTRVAQLSGPHPEDACPEPPESDCTFGRIASALTVIDSAIIRINGHLENLDGVS